MPRHQAAPQHGGLTVGGFFLKLVCEPLIGLRFLVLLLSATAILGGMWFLFFVGLPSRIGAERTGFSLAGFEGTVVFKAESGALTEYLALVHAQGRQDTGIRVARGQRCRFRSGGLVNVNFWGLVEDAGVRARLEEMKTAVLLLDRRSAHSEDVPEAHYDPTEIAMLSALGSRPGWCGPQGCAYSPDAWTARKERRLMPTAPLGALIGFVQTASGMGEPFYIGSGESDYETPADGTLVLAVNDVTFEELPDLYMRDNVGMFWLKISLR